MCLHFNICNVVAGTQTKGRGDENFEIGDNSFEYFEVEKSRNYYTLLIVQFLLNI